MTIAYIVQAEEGSGIPGEPEVFFTKLEADEVYVNRWREALGIEMDLPLPDDFEDYWPEDGGVRMWVIDITLPEEDLEWGEPGDCGERLDHDNPDERGDGRHYGIPHCIYCLQGM